MIKAHIADITVIMKGVFVFEESLRNLIFLYSLLNLADNSLHWFADSPFSFFIYMGNWELRILNRESLLYSIPARIYSFSDFSINMVE